MAYQTYTTEALVVGSYDHLSADRVILLFTREAGLIHARAISVRREQSKLRYSLQYFSHVRISLVRGKQGWRIIGAEQVNNLYFAASDRRVRGALLRVLKLVRRLVHGEETHVALYNTLIDGLLVLSHCRDAEIARSERILTLRILAVLGYIAPREAYQQMLMAPSLSAALSVQEDTIPEERAVQAAITAALEVSQL